MRWLESVLGWLSPTILLNGTPWAAEWEAKERRALINVCRIFLPLIALAWFLHYFMYDRPMGLEPHEQWLLLRMGNTALAMLGFFFYMTRIPERVHWYRLPVILVCAVLSISQAFVAKWYVPAAALFCFVFVIGSSILLRMSVASSLAFAAIVMAIQSWVLLETELAEGYLASGILVTFIMVALIRSSYAGDVRNFILNQQNIAAQQKITDLNSEFSARIRSFIPRVIADRLQRQIDREGRTVLSASLEVLEPRKVDVACLFSDIRGFTRGARELDSFIGNSVVPEMKACSQAIERHLGIPRKVGDLVFAYFDDDYVRMNLLRSVAAGLDIARLNADMNATSTEEEIRRYILISSGEAVVGNLGGLDSSVEITALGPPVNFLSRLDELTKKAPLSALIESGDIVLCERSARLLSELKLEIDLLPLDLREQDLAVRDFPDEHMLYILRPNDKNYHNVMEPYNYIRSRRESEHDAAANGGARITAP